LVDKAGKLGIAIPHEWWTTREDEPYIEKAYLDETRRTELGRLIWEEQLKRTERWVRIAVPIITALAGLIGTIIGLVSLYKK